MTESTYQKYVKWMRSRTPAEMELHREAFEFESKYFSDLCLTSPRVLKNLLQYEVQDHEGGWITGSDAVQVGIDGWILRYRRFPENTLGQCNWKTKTLAIRTELPESERTATLLHEMIHVYEYQLSQVIREWLLLDLYKQLSKRISPAKLDWYLKTGSHVMVSVSQHSLLFLLKSLDIDLRRKWEPGTCFGYGRSTTLNSRPATKSPTE